MLGPVDERGISMSTGAMNERAHDVTVLLQRIAAGDSSASDELFNIVYAQLRSLAQLHFRGANGAAHTLQPTALVHEAFLKIFGSRAPELTNREHLMATAASAMRTILVDRARRKRAKKRGENPDRVPLDAILVPYEDRAYSLIDLDDALKRLALTLSAQAARIVEMRFFGGLEHEAIAKALGISLSTVERDWRTARAWLRRELAPDGHRPDG
jgi:RNA polymerase sigma-70 factor (ECF subfamily)